MEDFSGGVGTEAMGPIAYCAGAVHATEDTASQPVDRSTGCGTRREGGGDRGEEKPKTALTAAGAACAASAGGSDERAGGVLWRAEAGDAGGAGVRGRREVAGSGGGGRVSAATGCGDPECGAGAGGGGRMGRKQRGRVTVIAFSVLGLACHI